MSKQPALFPTPRCGYRWNDGWGLHHCTNFEGHANDHRCECDGVLSQHSALRLEQERLEREMKP